MRGSRLDRFDSIGAPAARKLSALALCMLLTLPMPALLERMDSIIPHITSVWFEVRNRDPPSPPLPRRHVCLPMCHLGSQRGRPSGFI